MDGPLDALNGMYLVGARHSGKHSLTLHLGDYPGCIEASRWVPDLNLPD